MKLVTFQDSIGHLRPGIFRESESVVIDVSSILSSDTSPTDTALTDLIEQGDAARDALESLGASPPDSAVHSLAEVKLLAPIPRPKRNIFCVGKNYHEHAKEFHSSGFDASAGKDAIPDCPIIFSKSYTPIHILSFQGSIGSNKVCISGILCYER